jgi:hypothetical protein
MKSLWEICICIALEFAMALYPFAVYKQNQSNHVARKTSYYDGLLDFSISANNQS